MITQRALTPIEIAVDRACGMEPRRAVRIFVDLECLACGNKTVAPAERSYPEGTKKITVTCANCGDGSGDDVRFLGIDGQELGL